MTWQNLERLIAHLIMTIDCHFKAGGGGVRGTISFAGEFF